MGGQAGQPIHTISLPNVMHFHLTIHHIAKRALSVPRNNCDKIRTWLGIIMIWQSNGTTVMFLRIEIGWHYSPNAILTASYTSKTP